MNRYGSLRDVTATQRCAQPSAPHLLLALCGHKTLRLGAQMRFGTATKCAACNTKGKA